MSEQSKTTDEYRSAAIRAHKLAKKLQAMGDVEAADTLMGFSNNMNQDNALLALECLQEVTYRALNKARDVVDMANSLMYAIYGAAITTQEACNDQRE